MAAARPSFGRPRERGRLDRWLGLIADVEAGEGWGALLLAANICCLLALAKRPEHLLVVCLSARGATTRRGECGRSF